MQVIAAGRLAFWQGGSLWVFDVPRANAISRNDMHAHHAYQLTFALGGGFALHLEDRIVQGPAAIVAPDVAHAFEAEGLVALLFLAPESRAGRSLQRLMGVEPAREIGAAEARDAPSLIREAYDRPDSKDALRDVGALIAERIAGHVRAAEPDRRVRQMMAWADDRLDRALSISEVAGAVGLSPSRASHLFVAETGLPFRTYLLWRRLVRAVDAHARGASLTEAAQEAGFADSAHLSRTFRRMFGLPAASLDMS